MNFLLTANLSTKIASDGNGAWTPPTFTFGEQITVALRLTRNSSGTVIETSPVVNSMKAAIGNPDARPLGGTWKLKLGTDDESGANTTAVLQSGAPASALQTAINALAAMVTAYGAATVVTVDGSLLVTFAFGQQVTLTVVDNKLWPSTLGRVFAYERDGVWIHEIRLTQTPAVFTSTSSTVLPPIPQITEIQLGGSEAGANVNEIQEIYVPFEFRGTYYLQSGYARTAVLTPADGPDNIATALNAIAPALGAVGTGFTCTATLFQRANIEFVNSLGALPQALLAVHVASNPPGDLTFTMAMDRAELAALLRTTPEVTLPLQVWLNVTEDGITSDILAFSQDVTIQAPLTWPELEETPQINWLEPLSPKRYFPYDPNATLLGQHFYPAQVGDGAATVFAVAHGLGTLVVRTWVNSQATGAQLIEGTDYSVVINNANQVTVTALSGAPALNAWLIIVMSAQTLAAFATDLTIDPSQVNGLTAWQDSIGANLAQLNTLLPSQATVAGTTLAQGPFTITFPTAMGILFSAVTDPAKLPPRAPYMLPMVNTATVVALPVTPLPAPAADSVWVNSTGNAVTIPGGGMIRSSAVASGGNVASDGRMIWPARQSGATTSYFPIPFEVPLFDEYITARTFGVGSTLTLQLGLATQLIAATSHAQWMLVIEKGYAPREADPTAAAIDITTAGTGTHTATTELGKAVGAFTANASTDVLTLAAHGMANGWVILVASTGTLPGGLAANTLYVVRDVTTDTFRVAAVTTAQNLRDIVWDTANPIVNERIILTPGLTTHSYAATISRSGTAITANAIVDNTIIAANAAAPSTPNFAIRGRLINFDTQNSVPEARGWVFWQMVAPQSGALGISISSPS
jgi:hypothetical protein